MTHHGERCLPTAYVTKVNAMIYRDWSKQSHHLIKHLADEFIYQGMRKRAYNYLTNGSRKTCHVHCDG